jgi:hypothetical protein
MEMNVASRHRTTPFLCLAIVAFGLINLANVASAQNAPKYDRYQPLWQNSPPGTAARWAELTGKIDRSYFQPIKIITEDGGDIAVYHSRPVRTAERKSPTQLSVVPGHSYRFKISNMKELPGIEIFPTIEVIDRLHPPAAEKHNYPIPIHITREDITAVMQGKLVTHVIYLEQPQFAAPFELDAATRAQRSSPRKNAIELADRLGRPMIILRIGGRLPSVHGEPVTFWGTGGPAAKSEPTIQAAGPKEKNAAPNDATNKAAGDGV